MENDEDGEEVADLSRGRELSSADLDLPPGLPKGAPIEVTFEINEQGRLEMTARNSQQGAGQRGHRDQCRDVQGG